MNEGPRPLDPIVSLAVALAESPGSYAFFLGSGVSRDAGVPTGGEVLEIALNDLYRVENPESPLDRDALEEWTQDTGRKGMTYSEILELVGPEPEARRAYLAKYFEGRQPGETHRLLAQLAADGFARVFITTNFDRLLEHALGVVGITPTVVTADDDLKRASPREHAQTYVLKIHGDYLQQTIRNTAAELAQLEPKIEAELQEVVDRYGLVIAGYSGADEAVVKSFRKRSSRYGAYWVTRAAPTSDAAALIEAIGARIIERETAAEFLHDLRRRIAAYEEHPSGETPEIVAAEVLALLSDQDDVALREKVRAEWRALGTRLTSVIDARLQQGQASDEELVAVERDLYPGLERMLAALLPLIDHKPAAFDEQIEQMRRLVEKGHLSSPTTWPRLRQWSAWWLAQACGAYAVARGRFSVVGALVKATVLDHDNLGSLASMNPTELGIAVSQKAINSESAQNWAAPEWQHLIERLNASDFVGERYDFLLEASGGATRWLNEFNFLTSLAAVRQDERYVIAYWSMYDAGGVVFAQRLARDAGFRDEVASEVFGISGDELAATAKPGMQAGLGLADTRKVIYTPGRAMWNSSAIDVLPDPPRSAYERP